MNNDARKTNSVRGVWGAWLPHSILINEIYTGGAPRGNLIFPLFMTRLVLLSGFDDEFVPAECERFFQLGDFVVIESGFGDIVPGEGDAIIFNCHLIHFLF